MNEHVTRLAERLTVVRERGDRLDALCPVPGHGDTRPSLSVGPGKHGGAVIHCHAGCAPEDVVSAIGLTMTDLMPEPHVVDEYEYRDRTGNVAYRIQRWFPKDFRAVPGLPAPAERVLFQLDAIDHARATGQTLYVVEGEKSAKRLWEKENIPATTNALGAGKAGDAKWFPHYSDELAGLDVVIIADNDDPGRAHARAVAASLDGKARMVALTVVAYGKDVDDLLDAGYTIPSGLVPLSEDDGIGSIRADRVRLRRVSWVWPGYIPAGKLSTIDGDPGDGKSTLTIDLVARLTTGRPMPDQPDDVVNEPISVAMVSAEDDPEDTIAPRLIAAGADMRRVWLVTSGPTAEHSVDLLRDLPALEKLLRDNDVRWLVVDPLMAFMPGGIDAHKDADVRRALQPLANMAQRTGVGLTTVRHLNKGSGGKALYRGGGSIAFVGAARAAFLVGKHPDDEALRVLAPVKMNIAQMPPALGYRIETDPDYEMPRVAWSDEPVSLAAQDLSDGSQGEPRFARDEARDWFRHYLSEHPNGMRWIDLVNEGKKEGHSEHTLRRIRTEVAHMVRNPNDSAGMVRLGTYWFPLPNRVKPGEIRPPVGDLTTGSHTLASGQVGKSDGDGAVVLAFPGMAHDEGGT